MGAPGGGGFGSVRRVTDTRSVQSDARIDATAPTQARCHGCSGPNRNLDRIPHRDLDHKCDVNARLRGYRRIGTGGRYECPAGHRRGKARLAHGHPLANGLRNAIAISGSDSYILSYAGAQPDYHSNPYIDSDHHTHLDAHAFPHRGSYAHTDTYRDAYCETFANPNADGDAVSVPDAYSHGNTDSDAADGYSHHNSNTHRHTENRGDRGGISIGQRV